MSCASASKCLDDCLPDLFNITPLARRSVELTSRFIKPCFQNPPLNCAVINAEEEDRFYFILEGECQLKHAQAGELPPVTLDTGNPDLDVPSFYEGKTISRLGPGEFFGEGAVFPKMRRNWLVEAHGATKLYYINRMDLLARILFICDFESESL